ncbi:MAG: tetratricopeptide repeat protein [Planctomycetota bacterium]|nr:tetratricopeptide repeat protein [Planctomycetota bacterium]
MTKNKLPLTPNTSGLRCRGVLSRSAMARTLCIALATATLLSVAAAGCTKMSGGDWTPHATAKPSSQPSAAATTEHPTSAPAPSADAGQLADLWHDPTFQKQFIAGYGVNAEVEPRVTPEEVEVLEQVRPLMGADLPKAKALLEKNVTKDSSAIFDVTLGGICFQQDNVDQALACFREAVRKCPSFGRGWRNLGLAHIRKGNQDEAITAFTKMIELGGGDAYSYGLLGFAYASKEDYQAAEVAYRNALLLDPKNTEWRLGLTRCVFKQEKFQDAATLLKVLIQRYPDKADFWLLQAHTYLGMKKPLDAAMNLEAVDRMGKATPETLHTLGDIYVSEDLMDSAVHAYCRAVEVDAAQPVARPIRDAETLAAHGALPQARQVSDFIRKTMEAKVADADRSKLLKLDARLSMADGAATQETAKVLEDVVKLDPLDGEAIMLLGKYYADKQQPDRAIFWYERAGGIEKFEDKAKLRHAQILVGMRRFGDAVPLLRRVQEINKREDVSRYLEQVERAARSAKP